MSGAVVLPRPRGLLGFVRSMAEALALIIGIAVLVFVLLRLVPGDLVDMLASEGGFTTDMMASLRQELGLDRSVPEQLLGWMARALTGDFGVSLRFQQPIGPMVAAALPATLRLAAASFAIGLVLGVGLAVAAVIWPRSGARGLVEALNVWSIAVPTFCVGFLLIFVFVLVLRWMPLRENLILPALVIGIDIAGQFAKPLYDDIEEALGQPYVRAALAKGLSRRAVIVRHVLPNAASTLLALSGLVLGGLAGGTVTMEVLFSHNGIGKLTLDSVLGRDYPVTQACVVVVASAVVLANRLVAALARAIDPRAAGA